MPIFESIGEWVEDSAERREERQERRQERRESRREAREERRTENEQTSEEAREMASAIYSDHLKARREAAKEAKGQMLDESKVVNGSKPILSVTVKGEAPLDGEDHLNVFWKENVDFLKNDSNFPSGGYVASYGFGNPSISSAEFEGINIGSRRGVVNINDPLGVWPEIVGKISRLSNGIGRGAPNIEVQYGWIGLKNGEDNVQKIWGIVNETNFEMDENGLMKLSMKFIEDSFTYMKSLKFMEMLDMYKTDPSTEGVDNDLRSADQMLKYIINNTSIGEQLAKNRIVLNFGACSQEEDDALKLEDYSVTFGDSFNEKMNALIAKALPPPEKANIEGIDWSYNVIRQRAIKLDNGGNFGENRSSFSANETEVIIEIDYDWEPTPNPSNTEDAHNSREFSNNAEFLGFISWKPDIEMMGSETVYGSRAGGAPSESKVFKKTALSFNIDLSTIKDLFARLGSEISEIITNFDDQDINFTKQNIESEIGKINTDTPAESADFSNFEVRRGVSNGLFGWDWTQRTIESSQDFEDRRTNIQAFTEMQAAASGQATSSDLRSPAAKQVMALIRRNVFKASTSILGDPTLGSIIEPNSGYFVTSIGTESYFSQYFSGLDWLFQRAVHKFSEDGTYKTDLELLGAPNIHNPSGT